MKSGRYLRWLLGLALAASACVATSASAQGIAAQTAKIIELNRAGKHSEALTLARKTLAEAEKAHRPVHRDVAAALSNLGQAYASLGQDFEAEPRYKRALAIFEKTGGLDSADLAPLLNNLAALYQRQDRFGDAEPLFRRALVISERSLGASHADTADELNAVAKNLGVASSDIHLDSDASETALKRARLSDCSIVYFATHGHVAGDVRGIAEPSLALSIPAQPSELDDGLLISSEVAQLKLNADWVVLSACNTIAGDKPGAEALSGLARSFFYAGARALLVTHWAVDPAAATRLTTSAFDRLKADPNLGRAEALRQAMLAYLDDTSSPRNAYSAFWGPFVLVGEGVGH